MTTDDKSTLSPAMNCSLLSSPLVNDCYLAIHPIQQTLVVAWVALSELGITEFRDKGQQFVVEVLNKLEVEGPNHKAPTLWYFTDKLPRDEQGNIRHCEFEKVCTQTQVEALWLQNNVEQNACVWIGKVPLALSFFAGHFAEFPLVPGVVELQWCIDKIRAFLGREIVIERIDNLKFQKFLRPNDEFELTLTYQAEKSRVDFQFRTDNEICARGLVIIRNA